MQSFQPLRRELQLFFERLGVSRGLSDDLILATQEACNNAHQHSQDGAVLDVSVSCLEGTITIEIGDRGCGFDFEKMKTAWPPLLLKSGGRGLFLMAALTDQMEVIERRQGSLVRMFKAAEPGTGRDSSLPDRI